MTEPLKTLVVGCGNMGASHARAYRHIDGFNLVALVDRDEARRNALGEELDVKARYGDLDEALSAVQPDVVAIATWPDTHAAIAKKALEAGAHVFVEKPVATSVE